MVKGGELSS